METNDFFHSIGEMLGAAIRLVVQGLQWIFGNLYGAIDSFIHGLTGALGIDSSWFGILLLVIGLAMLYAGLRALLRRAFVGGVLWIVIGLILLSWLIH
ncbi:hypothetical protein [Salinisphaera sp. T31B1]|uniref:hypothetical protein n=1 Tax=Salinisphaera sp. T31B1 TaxID=727963 RepID=UPI00333F1D02